MWLTHQLMLSLKLGTGPQSLFRGLPPTLATSELSVSIHMSAAQRHLSATCIVARRLQPCPFRDTISARSMPSFDRFPQLVEYLTLSARRHIRTRSAPPVMNCWTAYRPAAGKVRPNGDARMEASASSVRRRGSVGVRVFVPTGCNRLPCVLSRR